MIGTGGRWLKKVGSGAIRLYLAPLRRSEPLAFFAAHHCFPEATEHLYRTVRMVRAAGSVAADAAIVDVGAADGGTAAYFRARFPANPIVAFEPNPRVADRLEETARRIGNMKVRRVALGAARAAATLHVTANNVSSSLCAINATECDARSAEVRDKFHVDASVPVEVTTLDDELADVPIVLLLKLDTQGTELDILQGAHRTLERTRFVLVEMGNHQLYEGGCQYHEVDAFLRGHSFRLADLIVSYCPAAGVEEFDALYARAVGARKRD